MDISIEDVLALEKCVELLKVFIEKIPIKRSKINFDKIKDKISRLKNLLDENYEEAIKVFKIIIKKILSVRKKEIIPELFYIVGGHGGVIINDIGFCEFDSPEFALKRLLERMKLAIETKMPYNIEIAVCCLEWLKTNLPNDFSEFLKLFSNGQFEIINPSFSESYNLTIGAESNIKQFEYGLRTLKNLELSCNFYYCSEASLHPQIPQILKGFNINHCSLRTRLLGICPSTHSGNINWIGLDNSKIPAITDQSGLFNGEYWHGTFYREIPNLLFQSVGRPFLNHILYSSIEDFIMPMFSQEEIWRISRFANIFGKFILCSEVFKIIETDGEYKYTCDDFYLGDYIFNQNELFLKNKKCETYLITAEIINCILGLFNEDSNDNLLEKLWTNLLLTQAHDTYVVPFTKPGDYSFQQLSEIEFKSLDIKENISILDLCIKILNDIESKCLDFIEADINKIFLHINKESELINGNGMDFFVLNPTIYPRKDVVSIPIILEKPTKLVMIDNKEEILNYTYQDSKIKFIAEVPPMGYSIYSLKEQENKTIISDLNFFYDINIQNNNETIQVSFKNKKVYELKFKSPYKYKLTLIKKIRNSIETNYVIQGKINDKAFNLQIIQFNGINRLEFILDSELLDEIILIPDFTILKTLVNYPFGMEETKRTKIQALDLVWLVGDTMGIVYIQKNSQKFVFNREKLEFRNIITQNTKFEFSISFLGEEDIYTVYNHLYSYHFRLIGSKIQGNHTYLKESDSFLTINPSIILTNLWRRKENSYLRILNPSIEENELNLEGLLIKNQLNEIDLNYNLINKSFDNKIKIDSWKIKTFQI